MAEDMEEGELNFGYERVDDKAKNILSSAGRAPGSQEESINQCDVPSGERAIKILDPEELPILSGEPNIVNPEKSNDTPSHASKLRGTPRSAAKLHH
ncbi:hypothetical protein A2U01_0039374, partial [Trifolium medium]|nr:hypothetical protein [Trifolium medium]